MRKFAFLTMIAVIAAMPGFANAQFGRDSLPVLLRFAGSRG